MSGLCTFRSALRVTRSRAIRAMGTIYDDREKGEEVRDNVFRFVSCFRFVRYEFETSCICPCVRGRRNDGKRRKKQTLYERKTECMKCVFVLVAYVQKRISLSKGWKREKKTKNLLHSSRVFMHGKKNVSFCFSKSRGTRFVSNRSFVLVFFVADR